MLPWLINSPSASSDSSDSSDSELDDLLPLHRPANLPAGLKNLGNTCYVNSFLQIWFHNVTFRKALYEWDPGQDPEEKDNETILMAEQYVPRGKVASLQVRFILLILIRLLHSLKYSNLIVKNGNNFFMLIILGLFLDF